MHGCGSAVRPNALHSYGVPGTGIYFIGSVPTLMYLLVLCCTYQWYGPGLAVGYDASGNVMTV